MKKILVLINTMIIAAMFSCIDEIPNDGEKIDMTPYKDIYVNDQESVYPINTAKSFHKAMHGYYMKTEQGYNNWFYHYLDDEKFNELSFDSSTNTWRNDESFIDGTTQKTNGYQVSKTFKVMKNGGGEVLVFGNVKSTDIKANSEFYITLNGNKVYPQNNDCLEIEKNLQFGYFYNFKLNVAEDDEIGFVTKKGSIDTNPGIAYSGYIEKSLNFDFDDEKFSNGMEKHVGDVHPFYYNNQMYMFYLETNGTYSSALLESKNMLTYKEKTINMGVPAPSISTYYAIGLVKYNDTFVSYYGASSTIINSAQSNDLYTWTNHSSIDSPKLGYPAGGRDPYLFYDEDIDKYRIIHIGYYSNNPNGDFDAALALQTSIDNNLDKWESKTMELLRFDNAGISGREDPEVSQMMKIGDRWYIFASIYSRTTHGVGGMSYWKGDANAKIDDVKWMEKPEQFVDGEDICAAQIVKVNEKYYMFGWVPDKPNAGQWGGAVSLPREIYQLPNGDLATKIDPYLFSVLNKGKIGDLKTDVPTVTTGNANINSNEVIFQSGVGKKYAFDDYNEASFNNAYSRIIITANLKLPKYESIAGFSFQSSNFNKHFVYVERKTSKLKVYTYSLAGSFVNSEIEIEIIDWNEVEIKIVLDRTIADVFVNDKYSLCAKLTEYNNKELIDASVSLFGAESTINKITIYKLTDLNDLSIYDR